MLIKEPEDTRTRTKSRPRSSGLSVSIFFFLAFMMLGWGCQRGEERHGAGRGVGGASIR